LIFHIYFGSLFCFCLHCFLLRQQLIATEKKWHFGFVSGKNVNFSSLLSVVKEVWYINQCNSCDHWTNGFIWKSFEMFLTQWWKIYINTEMGVYSTYDIFSSTMINFWGLVLRSLTYRLGGKEAWRPTHFS
jgi:hypothetical protein